MNNQIPSRSSRANPQQRWGAAAKYDFDNPNKWYTEYGVPLLDEHEMTDEHGRPIAYVDRNALQEIANNNNQRIFETGDPATLILGHTSDDPRAEEKPAQGFAVNYRVKPYRRDKDTGQIIYAIYGDYKVRPSKSDLIEKYPRRSVELWWHKKEIDPIAMLGGTTPERDLSVVIRKNRFKYIAMLGSSVPERDMGQTIRFHRRGNNIIESYQIVDLYDRKRYKKGVSQPKDESKGGSTTLGGRPKDQRRVDKVVYQCTNCDWEGTNAKEMDGLCYCPKCGSTTEPNPVGRYHKYDHSKEDYFIREGNEPQRKDRSKRRSHEVSHGGGKVGKVMSEFKHGTLHSGSKKGPKVTSPAQAKAIALSEARKAGEKVAKKKERADMDDGAIQYGMHGSAEHYAMGPEDVDDEYGEHHAMHHEDEPEDFDEPEHLHGHHEDTDDDNPKHYGMGDGNMEGEGHDASDGMGPYGQHAMDGEGEDNPEADPLVAKVFASRQWQDMSSKLDMILQAIQGQEEPGMGEQGGMGGEMGGGMDQGGMEGGQGMEQGGEEQMPQGEEENPDEEEREFHGEKPVQFNSTGMPGPGNTYQPGFVGGGKGTEGKRYGMSSPKHKQGGKHINYPGGQPDTKVKHMSRNGQGTRNGRTQRTPLQEEVIRLRRSNQGLVLRLARMDAERIIRDLVDKGIVFGDTPQEHAEGMNQEIEYMTLLSPEDQEYAAENILKRYKRKPVNPSRPGHVGVARYARPDASQQPESEEEFEPQDPMEATLFADMTTGQNPARKTYSRTEAIGVIRKRRMENQRNGVQYDYGHQNY